MTVDTLICPTDCSATLPEFSFNPCNTALLQSQIDHIYLGNVGQPFVNPEDPAEWGERLALTTEPNAVRDLIVMGALADPTSTTRKIAGGQVVYSPKTFTLTGDIFDNTDTNYNAARATGCNGQYWMWYTHLGGKMYGETNGKGILVNVSMWEPITNSDEDYVTIKFSLQWTSRFIPLRWDNPIAA